MPWIRFFSPTSELNILKKRQTYTDEELAAQSDRVLTGAEVSVLGFAEKERHKNFTFVSALQYTENDYPQALFGGVNKTDFSKEPTLGLIIEPKDRTVLFRHSSRGDISDDIFKKPHDAATYTSKLSSIQFQLTHESDLPALLKARYDEMAADGYYQDHPDETPELMWTEGCFRYKAHEITGIIVDSTNRHSVKQGYAFSRALRDVFGCQKHEFFVCDKGKLTQIERQGIIDLVAGENSQWEAETLALYNQYKSALTQQVQLA